MSRDTQFQGFAKALLKELLDDSLEEYGFLGGREQHPDLDYDLNICEGIIARRAYDLAESAAQHALLSLYSEDGGMDTQEIVESIPDMAELPIEKEG